MTPQPFIFAEPFLFVPGGHARRWLEVPHRFHLHGHVPGQGLRRLLQYSLTISRVRAQDPAETLIAALGRWQRIAPTKVGRGLPVRAGGVVTLPPGRLLVAELCIPRGAEW